VEFVLDEVVSLFVDDYELDLVGQCPFERSSEREPGVAGTENGDTHSHGLGPDG